MVKVGRAMGRPFPVGSAADVRPGRQAGPDTGAAIRLNRATAGSACEIGRLPRPPRPAFQAHSGPPARPPGAVRAALAALLLAAFGVSGGAGPARAHPHVFINNIVTFVFEAERVTGLRLEWQFDEVFSATLIQDFDRDGNGRFDESEVAEIQENAFSNLRDYGYFTYLWLEGRPFPVTAVEDFHASLDGERVAYSFLVPLPEPVDPREVSIRAAVYDSEYYVEVVLDAFDPVRFEGASRAPCSFKIAEDSANAYYYGLVYPEQITLECGAG